MTTLSARSPGVVKRIHSFALRVAWPAPLVIAYVFYITGPALGAEFSILDDHLVPHYLGPDGKMTWSETVGVLRAEALTWANRFLPVHFGLRVIEIKWRGFDAAAYHLDRTILACVCGLSVFTASVAFIRPLGAAALSVAYLAGPTSHAFINLGFPEVFGSALALLGAAVIAVGVRRERDRPLQVFAGFFLILLAGACKESFMPLLLAALAFTYLPRLVTHWRVSRPLGWRWYDWVAVSVLMLGTLGILCTNLLLFQSHGHQYRGSINGTQFLYAMKMITMSRWSDSYWPIAVLAAVWAIWMYRSNAGIALEKQIGWLAAAIGLGFVLLVLPQCVIYGSSPMFFERYLVPGNLFVVFTAGVALWVIGKVSRPTFAAWVTGFVSVVMIVAAAVAGRQERAYAADFAKASREFHGQLQAVEALKLEHPTWPIVFQAGAVMELEPIVSTARFLAAGRVAGSEMFLIVPHYRRHTADPMEAMLADKLEALSADGGEGFRPAAQLQRHNDECIGVVFFGSAPTPCRHSVGFAGARF